MVTTKTKDPWYISPDNSFCRFVFHDRQLEPLLYYESMIKTSFKCQWNNLITKFKFEGEFGRNAEKW